jgi:hypothetical protein
MTTTYPPIDSRPAGFSFLERSGHRTSVTGVGVTQQRGRRADSGRAAAGEPCFGAEYVVPVGAGIALLYMRPTRM